MALVQHDPHPDVLTDPPILAVEILSPDKSCWEVEERAADYLAMGIQSVWIIDPKTRTGRMCVGKTWIAANRLIVPNTAIYVELADIFRALDEPAGLA